MAHRWRRGHARLASVRAARVRVRVRVRARVRVSVRVRVWVRVRVRVRATPSTHVLTLTLTQVPSAGLTRRPPSPEAAPHGRPCHSHGPVRFPSSWAVAPAPSKPPASPPVAAPRLRICAPTR